MRLLADMGVSRRVAEWLRNDGHDVVHLRDEGLHRLPDPEIFAKAQAERRIVLTFDLDFARIAAAGGSGSASVILFRLVDATSPRLHKLADAALARFGDLLSTGAIVVVEDARMRARRFPLRPDVS